MNKLIAVLTLVFIVGCGGISMINKTDTRDLYTAKFLNEIDKAKNAYSLGRVDEALQLLEKIDQNALNQSEVALRNNLIGVIFFSKENYDESIKYFEKGLETSSQDPGLTAQLSLNLGSSRYKKNENIRAYAVLKTVDQRYLRGLEKIKYFRLFYILAKEIGDDRDALRGLTSFLGTYDTVAKIKQNQYYEDLVNGFFKLGRNEKVRFLEEFTDRQNLVAGYLGFLEMEKLLYNGEKSYALEMASWIKSNFDDRKEIIDLVEDFEGRVESISKINGQKIGVVLPFTGKRKEFANRTMLGFDYALSQMKQAFENKKIITVDSQGNELLGRLKVRELIEKHSVSVIIGGLFSDEAKAEYLEARKYGVLFVSLSPIYLPKNEKSYLLLEVPGSVESQVSRIISPDIINEFGNRVAVIYPDNNRGRAYIDELWSKSLDNKIKITAVQSYDDGSKDFREPVAKILGVEFKRERKEELEFMQNIYSLQKSSIRRVQVLPPEIDYDWIFAPSYPQQAIQIIPSFAYYDAFDVKFFGGPSWRSRMLNKIVNSNAKVHFVGDNIAEVESDLLNDFVKKYKRRPRLIEIMGLESLKLISQLDFDNVENREGFNVNFRQKGNLAGLAGNFTLSQDGLWIKDLEPYRMIKNKTFKLTLNENSDNRNEEKKAN